ncbi:MAG: 2-hydroxychromene-2-carboxylate isomerase [Gammaproteobacteria bacterium]|jgi:2-hydroxychromene-2-carboxylate isomerase|nr:2-hydroxychromene-2-carboxylate isomerase [Gammaproteobacteria bacterium]
MKVSWVFDLISPYSYLALKQLPLLPAGTELKLVPVLFAGLLNHHGQVGPAEITSKRRFTYRFIVWRARKMGVPLKMPPAHPFNPLSALRLVIAAGSDRRSVETAFDFVFGQGRDVADPAVLVDLARELGVADVQAALNDPDVKQTLRSNTDWAIERGVFGVPTFVIGPELFWGHDALEMAVDYLRDPAQFNDREMSRIDTLPVGVTRPRVTPTGRSG